MTKIVIALIVTTLLGPIPAADATVARAAGAGAPPNPVVAWALSRFADAGLELPPLSIVVHDDETGCGGHDGSYDLGSRIDLCTSAPLIVLHELAHVWEQRSVPQDVRDRFMAELGVDVWNDTAVPWRDRAVEIAANVVAWGLLDSPLTAPAARSFPVPLARFEMLTGSPSPRLVAPAEPEPTPEQRALIAWADARFSGAGLEPPQVTLVFHETLLDCSGHVGLYVAASDTLHLCRLDEDAILHELAHAWADEHLTDDTRLAFAGHRGLDAWNDQEAAWKDRATEQAAEILAWGLSDRERTVRWVGEDGTATRILLTIPDSEPERLTAGFRLLTGLDPAYRVAG